jgi:hypothetical protein
MYCFIVEQENYFNKINIKSKSVHIKRPAFFTYGIARTQRVQKLRIRQKLQQIIYIFAL